MLWLALEFPHLALDALGDTEAAAPLAICEQHGSRRRVADCNAAAHNCGVRAGMPLDAAHALSAALRVLPRRPRDERAALIRRATWALRFSPMVGVRGDDRVLLEIAASCRLFGGLRVLLARIRRELDAAGYGCRAAAAPTPGAAVLLARTGASRAKKKGGQSTFPAGQGVSIPFFPHGKGTLTPFFLGALYEVALALSELPATTIAAFAGIGVHTVGAVLRLPRAELGRRFGQATVDYLDRVLGTRADPVERFVAPERFCAELELACPVHGTEALVFGAARLLRELGDWLQARQLAVQRYTLSLRHEDHAPTQLQIGLRLASTAHEHLLALLRARLENLRLPDAVHALVLEAPDCAPLRGANADLFERAAQADEDAERLLERLRSRLGEAAVRQVQLRPEHRPELAVCSIPSPPSQMGERVRVRGQRYAHRQLVAKNELSPLTPTLSPICDGGEGDSQAGVTVNGGAEFRPLYLLDPPQPLEHWRDIDLDALTLCGPERIESGWWDAQGMRRDYFRAHTPDGATYWIFREHDTPPRWFVHGIFA